MRSRVRQIFFSSVPFIVLFIIVNSIVSKEKGKTKTIYASDHAQKTCKKEWSRLEKNARAEAKTFCSTGGGIIGYKSWRKQTDLTPGSRTKVCRVKAKVTCKK